MSLTILFAAAAISSFICFLYTKRKSKMQLLKNCGIPGPTPHLLWGNMTEYYSMPNVVWDTQLIQKYGPIAGYYLGAKPFVLVADPDLLEIIQNKEAKNFLDRPRKVPGGINPDPNRALMMGNLPVPEWIHVRRIIAPTFGPSKLKEMLQKMSQLSDKMLDIVSQKAKDEEEVNFYALFQALTLDIIGTTAFGVDSNIQDNPDDPLLKAVVAEFAKTTNSTLVQIYLCFPEISFLLHPLRKVYQRLKDWFGFSEASALWNHGKVALANVKPQTSGENGQVCESESEPKLKFCLLEHLLKTDMTHGQIVANSVLIFEAAYETLSGSLGFITHLLVKYPDVQKELREEVEIFFQENGTLDTYKIMTGLKYLDAVIAEGLRLFPPQTTFIGRAPAKTFQFRNYTLPAGIHIQVALYQIQNSPENWTDPTQFRPERHLDNSNIDTSTSAEQHKLAKPITLQPFGIGRRRCIGEKFGLLALKLVLAKLIHQFQLVHSSKSESEVTIQFKLATMTPKNGSWALPIPVVRKEE